ncbi:MAG: hypothetical protein NTZ42_04450 [Candidatus Gribaldobacteria bacterium]|nr:hypothetical protein [Candidatus Gribaldobacteria bacterium]
MGKNSKQHNNAIDFIKRKIHCFSRDKLDKVKDYVEKIEKIKDGALIPPAILTFPTEEEVEDRNFSIFFDYLDEKECNFSSITDTKAVAMIKKFKLINSTAQRNIKNLGVKPPIGRDSGKREYDALFDNLPQDVDTIFEIPFADEGRLFFFLNASADFFIIAIKTEHINLHKE